MSSVFELNRAHTGSTSGGHGSNVEEAVWGKVNAKGYTLRTSRMK